MDEIVLQLVQKHNLAVEGLTELQLAEAIRQAIQSGDFMRYVVIHKREQKQCVTYLPWQECERIRDLYSELINSVASKHEGETRHQTALRYIKEGEEQWQDESRSINHLHSTE